MAGSFSRGCLQWTASAKSSQSRFVSKALGIVPGDSNQHRRGLGSDSELFSQTSGVLVCQAVKRSIKFGEFLRQH
jgi:hypothetical protein